MKLDRELELVNSRGETASSVEAYHPESPQDWVHLEATALEP